MCKLCRFVCECSHTTGDLLGSGTISGPQPEQQACLLERTRAGKLSLQLSLEVGGSGVGGEVHGSDRGQGQAQAAVQRAYLHDGDTVILRGWAELPGALPYKIGFGECRGSVLPCLDPSP
jgi:fumarylacetoacetase